MQKNKKKNYQYKQKKMFKLQYKGKNQIIALKIS